MIGTYSLVLIGPGTVVAVSLFSWLSALSSLVLIALSFGATVATAIAIFGNRSGAHINPAVTVACSVSGIMRRSLVLPYVSLQVIGGLFAGLTLRLLFGSQALATGLGSTRLAVSINPVAGTVVEAVGTMTLVLAILFTVTNVQSLRLQGFVIGTTLFLLILFIGPLTGASFNPARSFGPAVASGYLSNQLVYWIGPLSGALIGATLFSRIQKLAGREKKNEDDSLCMC